MSPAPPPATPPVSPLAVTLRELAWTIHKRAPDRAGVGPLPTTEIALLKQVLDSPGSTVRELSAALGLRQPNTSAALRVLAGRGLVERHPGADDRRTVRIEPTELGRREHAALAGDWAGAVAEAITRLPARRLAELESAADALAELTRLLQSR